MFSYLSRLSVAEGVLSPDCDTRSPRNLSGIFHTLFISWLDNSRRPRPPHCWGLEITLRHNTLATNLVEEWTAGRKDLFLTTHKGCQSQTSMSPAGFETPSASKRATTDPRLWWHFSTYISYAYMRQDSRHGVCKKLHWQKGNQMQKNFQTPCNFPGPWVLVILSPVKCLIL
jgi:hypothetical protein